MNRIIVLLAICSIAVYARSEGTVVEQGDDQAAAVAASVDAYAELSLSDIDISTMDAEKLVEDYINEHPSYGESPNWIGSSVAFVQVDSAHRDWAKHRALAYKRAWSDLQKQFIETQQIAIKTELIKKLYVDASGDTPQFEPDDYTGSGAIDEFIDKAGAFVAGKLNAALEDLGINPDEYSRNNSTQRKVQVEDSIRQKTVISAVGKTSGLWPLKTFITEVNGQYAIGVVGLYTPAYEAVARQIATNKYPVPGNKPGVAPRDLVAPPSSVTLISNFGVRPIRDERGLPALISFGQWGVSKLSNNPAIAATFRQAAFKQARIQADAELAVFLNGSANAADASFVGELAESYTDVDRSGYSEQGDALTIEDILDQTFTAKGKAKLAGLKDLRSWTYVDAKTGQTLVGVVRYWTVQNALDARAIRSAKNPPKRGSMNAQNRKPAHSRSATESLDFGGPDDF